MTSEIPTAKDFVRKKPQAALRQKLTNKPRSLQSRPACGGITLHSRCSYSVVSEDGDQFSDVDENPSPVGGIDFAQAVPEQLRPDSVTTGVSPAAGASAVAIHLTTGRIRL